jgi:hypothetical protein
MSAIAGWLARLGTLSIIGLSLSIPGAKAAIAADTALVESSSGTTVSVTVGQTIAVDLPSSYVPITVTGAAVTAVSSSGGFPTGQPLTATLLAVAPGVLDLRTMTDYPCLHSVPRCAVPQRQWIVHVTVVSSAATVTVTETDSGSTIGLRVGDTLVVSLGRDYRPTRQSGPALQLRRLSGGFPTGQPLLARYRAVQPDEVDVNTMTDYACLHTTPACGLPQRQWILHVHVTA